MSDDGRTLEELVAKLRAENAELREQKRTHFAEMRELKEKCVLVVVRSTERCETQIRAGNEKILLSVGCKGEG